MDASIFLAKVFGLYFIIVSAALLLRPKLFQELVDEFLANRAVMFFGGIIALIVGILLVVTHNIWVADWRILITLISWIVLIKGIIYLFLLPEIPTWMTHMMKRTSVLLLIGGIDLLVGLFFAYKGFFS